MTNQESRLPAGTLAPAVAAAPAPAAHRLLAPVLLALACLALAAPPAAADPAYGDLVLPGLDPALSVTRDPRLLGAERLWQRERLLRLGADPERGQSPTLEGLYRASLFRELKVDLERREVVREIYADRALESTIAYPKWLLLFPAAEPLPGGFSYYPPRAMDAPGVELTLDEPAAAAARRREVAQRNARVALLDVRASKGSRAGGESMINLTIPIKLPHTLEKIIGRGEKTNIKITGREYIRLSGESTTSNQFLATERRSKPSLFPTLDMEQQLQVNLSGTIGEKILIEVDYNSQAVGTEGTKIKLSYRGNEDEVIQTIETGDVGLTLPGSSLLGYSSNKSGLFGIKVTGQVGPADFTVVASKQKAESASKSFNSKGGEVSEHIIECQNYVRNRFFRLDLPPPGGVATPGYDDPGRPAGWEIDPTTVQVYVWEPSAQGGAYYLQNAAAYVDASGLWFDSQAELEAMRPVIGKYWRQVLDVEQMLDQRGSLVALDLGSEFGVKSVLAVYYEITNGTSRRSIGAKPGVDESATRVRADPSDPVLYLPLKLLKPQDYSEDTAHTWNYPLRNIYSLGGVDIDRDSFDLRVEFNDNTLARAYEDSNGLNYLRIFGLDNRDAQNNPVPDNMPDKDDATRFDLVRGLLKFPINVLEPFNADRATYEANAASDPTWGWEHSRLKDNLTPQIYDWRTPAEDYHTYARWRIVASHAAASGTINLNVSNIEEGSETVTLDGRALQRGMDYEIDYQFGQVTLKGQAAADLTPDSQIAVNYQYAPFMGGGNSSLVGFNMGYDLGRDSRVSTTWLYETTQIAGYKPKLGEEPSRTLVGNLNVQHTLRPGFLTHFANLLTRRDSDKESTLQVKAEVAASVPNPNTMGSAFVEDFEGIDDSDILPISRLSWYPASVPVQGRDLAYTAATGDTRDFEARTRASTYWFLPKEIIQRRFLNPDLKEQEGREGQQVLELYMKAGPSGWRDNTWGGVMRGLGSAGINLAKAQFLEFWVNDFQVDRARRHGRLHVDFGYVSEDYFWPTVNDTTPVVGTYQKEDRLPIDTGGNGVFTVNDEDTGLDGVFGGGDKYDDTYVEGERYFPNINGMESNNREDDEDLDGDTSLQRYNGYYSIAVDLADSALVDVLRDYPPERTVDVRNANQSWRKYRIRLNDALTVSPPGGLLPKITEVTHVRIWYEDEEPDPPQGTHLQLSDIKFLGSRWERDGVRKRVTEQILSPVERGANEGFFIGEVNNKENPDYYPPFGVREENNIAEKEQSLVLDFTALERDHVARIGRLVSPRGDNYTRYGAISWWWYNPSHEQSDLELFFRVGSDTTNYYEVSYRFDESAAAKTGWHKMAIALAELTNAKFAPVDPETGWITTTVPDRETGQPYRARVVGRPDLQKVRRFYMGVINASRDAPVSGYFYLNDVRLEDVRRESGMAKQIGLRLNMADAVKLDFDWKKQDAEFHGLNASTGLGYTNEEWSLSTSFRADDFVPLAGWRVPVSLSRQRSVRRPKWMTNSDIEIMDPAIIAQESAFGSRESYSLQLKHDPSRQALLRYVVDPWSFTLSGSRDGQDQPLSRTRKGSMQGSLTYDLHIGGQYALGRVWEAGHVPVLRDVAFLPRKVTASASFSRVTQNTWVRETSRGEYAPRAAPDTRQGTLSGSMEWSPLPLADVTVTVRSQRDLLRRREMLGLNIGEETQYGQEVGIHFNTPKATSLPRHWLVTPLRVGVQVLNTMRPQIGFNGKFEIDRNPSLRLAGDPPNLRSLSNGGDWSLRLTVPLDELAKAVVKPPAGGADRERLRERQRRGAGGKRRPVGELEGEVPGGGAPAGAPADTTAAPGGVGQPGGEAEEDLTPEERLRRDQEAQLEEMRQEEEAERRARPPAPGTPGAPTEPVGGRTPAAASGKAGADSAAARAAWDRGGGGGRSRLRLDSLYKPVVRLLRNTEPIQLSYGVNKGSAYTRYRGEDEFWYRVGLRSALDAPDSLAAVVQLTERRTVGISTNVKLAQTVKTEVRFTQSTRSAELKGQETDSYQQDWPDLRVSLTGLERWRVFGGGDGKGWFRSSSLDLGYKYSRSVSNYTATSYNPHMTTTWSPRWNVTFPSGLAGSINLSINNDVQVTSGSRNEQGQFNVGVQFRHSFRAERVLARMHLYRPGSSPTVTMDVNVNYRKSTVKNINAGSAIPNAETGNTSLGTDVKFNTQVTRNLTAGLFLTFSRNKNIQQDLVTKTFGLGFDATFTF